MSTVIIGLAVLLSHLRTTEFDRFDLNRSILCSNIYTKKTRGMCDVLAIHNWHAFRLMQARLTDILWLMINFSILRYLVCIFIFKNITLDQDNSIV